MRKWRHRAAECLVQVAWPDSLAPTTAPDCPFGETDTHWGSRKAETATGLQRVTDYTGLGKMHLVTSGRKLSPAGYS